MVKYLLLCAYESQDGAPEVKRAAMLKHFRKLVDETASVIDEDADTMYHAGKMSSPFDMCTHTHMQLLPFPSCEPFLGCNLVL